MRKWAFGLAFLGAVHLTFQARGQAAHVEILAGQAGSFEVRWTNQPPGLMLETTENLSTPVVWQPVTETPSSVGDLRSVLLKPAGMTRFYRLRGGAPTAVVETSPAPGESGVSLTRETIFRFSRPLADGTQLATDRLYTEFGGRRLLSRVELSSDRLQATLFYLEPLPSGSRLRTSLVCEGLLDNLGEPVDGDGDGQPGGTRRLTFETMSVAPIPGTAVMGHVYASEQVPTANGMTNLPLAGVVISVDGAEERLRATTDETGFFVLQPCPAGRFFVHVDGRVALGSSWPDGAYYPFVGKTFEAVPGRTNNLAGGTGEVFLPLVRPSTLRAVSATQVTTVGFPDAVLAEHPELGGVSITVPPNALFADDGTRGGRVGIAPVEPERIPSPLPPGLDFPVVITIQTDGPSNFDRPVSVRFPNLPDPVSGVLLPPGAKSALWSYNHDTGRWEVQGSMTVSADGKFVETDPGVGARQPGWHASAPGSAGVGGGGNNGPCSAEQQALEDAMFSCAFGIGLGLLEVAPAIGCGISVASAVNGMISGCSDPNNSCAGSVAYNAFFGAAGCIPGPVGGTIGTFAGLLQCSIELGAAVGDLAACQSIHPPSVRLALRSSEFPRTLPSSDASSDLQDQLLTSSSLLVTSILGDPVWLQAASLDHANMTAFANALVAALGVGSDGGVRISSSEQTLLLGMAAPGGLSLEVRSALLQRMDRFASGGISVSEKAAIQVASDQLSEHSTRAQGLGWETMLDGMMGTWAQVVTDFDNMAKSQAGEARLMVGGRASSSLASAPTSRIGPPHERVLLYRVVDQTTGLVRRGQTDRSGELAQLILAPDRPHILTYLDPVTLEMGSVFFVSGSPGGRITLPHARFATVTGSDGDSDGLTDLQEAIVGSNPTKPDTDADGVNDYVEVKEGLNPLDGLALGEGVVASLGLGGRALGLHLDGTQVFVANGKAGLAVVDVTNPLQPTSMSQLGLPGESYDVAYSSGERVAGLVALPEAFKPGERGLFHLVDLSNPMAPSLLQSYSLPAVAVDAWNGRFYVALGQYALKEVRLFDPRSALEIGRFTTQDFPTGLRVVGGRAYVATLSGLEIFDVSLIQPVRLGRLAGEFSPEILGRVHLVLEGTTLFVGKTKGPVTIDVSNPAAPSYLGLPIPNAPVVRSLALNGAGRLLALTGGTPTGNTQGAAFFSIYRVTDPANLGDYEFSLSTPGRARDLVTFGGLAIVADDSAGLTVLSFGGQDTTGQAPVISFDATPLDQDAGVVGIQSQEGNRVELAPRVQEDVKLDHVEVLLNGQVLQTLLAFPPVFSFSLPLWASDHPACTLQFRAVDRAGNTGNSEVVTLQLSRDRQAPTLVQSLPTDGGGAFLGHPIVLRFSESLDPAGSDSSKARLLHLGADGKVGGGDDSEVGVSALSVVGATLHLLPSAQLAPGRCRLLLQAGMVRDLAGNGSTLDSTLLFDLVDAHPGTVVWVADVDGQFDEPSNWLQRRVPTHDDDVLIARFSAKPRVLLDSNAIIKNARIETAFTTASRGSLTVLGNLTASESFEVPDGNLFVSGNARFEKALAILGGRVEVSGKLDTRSSVSLGRGGGLTLSGPAAEFLSTAGLEGADFSLTAADGAVVSVNGLSDYIGLGDFTSLFAVGTAFRAQGSGSRLTLGDMSKSSGPTNWNVWGAPSVAFEAVSGGALVLPKLTSVTGRTKLLASGAGSLIDAPLLGDISGPDLDFPSALDARDAGTIHSWIITNLVRCIVTLDSLGTIQAPQVDLAETSVLRGIGALDGNLLCRGAIQLDRSPGSLHINGGLTLTPSSRVEVTLGSGTAQSESGVLEVKGAATLAGGFKVVLAKGYQPMAGQQFRIADLATPSSGSFTTLDDSALGLGLRADLVTSPVALDVKLAPR